MWKAKLVPSNNLIHANDKSDQWFKAPKDLPFVTYYINHQLIYN
jgi:hypothetical protein